uniref:Uncharacterized protein n=1 Tax=Arundo donax TaxID=35708 RepID=A0A0A9BQ09_ARUDO
MARANPVTSSFMRLSYKVNLC